jgi:hypothetical protein
MGNVKSCSVLWAFYRRLTGVLSSRASSLDFGSSKKSFHIFLRGYGDSWNGSI